MVRLLAIIVQVKNLNPYFGSVSAVALTTAFVIVKNKNYKIKTAKAIFVAITKKHSQTGR
jgi:hypothetical protein